jgi:hypothetical protein
MLLAPVQIARAPSPIRFFHHQKTRLLRLLSSSFPFYTYLYTQINMCVCGCLLLLSVVSSAMSTREEKLTFRSPPLSWCCCCLSTSVWCLTVSADSHLCLFSQWSYSFFWLFHFLFILLPLNFLEREILQGFLHISAKDIQLHSPISFPPPIYPTVSWHWIFFSVFSHHCLSLSILFVCFISLGRSDFFLLQCTRRISLSKSWVDVRARAATPISLSPLDLAAIER